MRCPRPWCAALLTAVCVHVGNLQAQAEEHDPATEQHANAGEAENIERAVTEQAATQAGLLEAVSRMPRQAETRHQEQRAEEEGWTSPAMVNRGLLVVGILYTIFAAFQWAAIRQQVRGANYALRIQQRPHLLPHEEYPIRFNDAQFPIPSGQPVHMEFTFQNHGNSPALGVQLFLKFKRLGWESLAPDAEIFILADRPDLNITMIGPRYSRTKPCPDVTLDAADALALNGHHTADRLWAIGRIDYWDGFRLSGPYTTEFSLYWHPERQLWVMAGPLNNCVDPPDGAESSVVSSCWRGVRRFRMWATRKV
ncbi:MAG: hypothetical protein ACREJO_18160 [Phycisphaerales bacterium]